MSDAAQISALETAYNIPQGLYSAIVNDGEASGSDATSPKGAYGRAQLMPATARSLGVDPSDPNQNLEGGARYVAQLGAKYNWNPQLVAAAYNAGPTAVDNHGGVPPYAETQAYVNRVVPAYQQAQDSAQPSDADLEASFQAQQGGGGQAPSLPPNTADPAASQPSDADLQKSFDASQAPATYQGATKTVAPDGSISYRDAGGHVVFVGNPQSTISQDPDGTKVLSINGSDNPDALADYEAKHPLTPRAAAPALSDFGKWLDYHFNPANQTAATNIGGDLQRADAEARAFANTVTGGFADKAAAAVDAFPQGWMHGAGALGGAYSQNLTAQQAQDAQAQLNNPGGVNAANQLGDMTIASAIPLGAGGGVLANIGRGALQGGAISGINALGHARGGISQELQSSLLPTAAGALTGGALGPLANIQPAQAAPQIASIDDYERTGVDPMLAVNGGRNSQQMGAMLRGLPFVGTPLARAATKTVNQVDQGIQATAGQLGGATDAMSGGVALQQGASDALAAMKAKSRMLYEPINQMEANSTPIRTDETQAATQAMMDRFPNTQDEFRTANPVTASIHDAMRRTNGKTTFGELKALRSQVGQQMDPSSILNNSEAANLKRVYAAMSKDLENGAGKLHGRSGRAAIKAANEHEAEMHRVVEETLGQVIARERSGAMMPREQAFNRLAADARLGGSSDIEQLGQLKAALPPDAWGNVGAAMIHTLGRDAQGFSTAKFATAWEKLTPAAKDILFPTETRESLDALARISKQMKAAGAFYNHSNSGHHTVTALALMEPMEEVVRHASSGNLVGAAHALLAPAAIGIAGRVTATLLAHPGFARLVLNAGKTESPSMVDAMFARYARKNPDVAPQVNRYRAVLMTRMRRNTPVQSGAAIAGQAVQKALQGPRTLQ